MNIRKTATGVALLAALTACTSHVGQPDAAQMPDGHGTMASQLVGPKYGSPLNMIAAVRVQGFDCRVEQRPYSTMYSYRSLGCFHKAADGAEDYVKFDIYRNAGQLESGQGMLLTAGGGGYYLFGNLWTIQSRSPEAIKTLQGMLGGERARAE